MDNYECCSQKNPFVCMNLQYICKIVGDNETKKCRKTKELLTRQKRETKSENTLMMMIILETYN